MIRFAAAMLIATFSAQAGATQSTWGLLRKVGSVTITGQFQDGLPVMTEMDGSTTPGWPQSWSNKNLVLRTQINVNTVTEFAGCGSANVNLRTIQCGGFGFIARLDGVALKSYWNGVTFAFDQQLQVVSVDFVASDEFGYPGYLSGLFTMPLSTAAKRVNLRGQEIALDDPSEGLFALRNGTYRFDRISTEIAGHFYQRPRIPADLLNVTVTIAGAVPEPKTWLTLLAGFGLVGSVLRVQRSRRSATC